MSDSLQSSSQSSSVAQSSKIKSKFSCEPEGFVSGQRSAVWYKNRKLLRAAVTAVTSIHASTVLHTTYCTEIYLHHTPHVILSRVQLIQFKSVDARNFTTIKSCWSWQKSVLQFFLNIIWTWWSARFSLLPVKWNVLVTDKMIAMQLLWYKRPVIWLSQ